MVAKDGSDSTTGFLPVKTRRILMAASTSAAGSDVTMVVLADKMSRGTRLTHVDQSLVISNAAKIFAHSFGPMPEDLRLPEIQIPENVRGVLANYSL
jgi:hypothetical protein